MSFIIKNELKNWRDSECTCTKGSSNVECPLHMILYKLRKKVSFDVFVSFVKQTGSIARLPSRYQKRPEYLKYTSKCRSGRFYRRMDPTEDRKIQEHPETYSDSDDEANAYTDDGEASATDEYESEEKLAPTPPSPNRPDSPRPKPLLHRSYAFSGMPPPERRPTRMMRVSSTAVARRTRSKPHKTKTPY